MDPVDRDKKMVIRALYHLIGKMYLFRAGTGGPTPEEWSLIDDLEEWYQSTGKRLIAERQAIRP
jgi:hypothetical protein